MTIDQFEKELNKFGQAINNIDLYLLEVSGQIVSELKAKSPYDTGELRKSIRSAVSNNTMEIKMLNYGAFQNYGVKGTNDSRAKEVQFGVSPRPRVEPFYSFQSRQFGIKPKGFFNIDDISTMVTDHLQKRILENI